MISEVYYTKEIDPSLNPHIYDDKYLVYLITKFLYKNGPSTYEEIKQYVKGKVRVSNINSKKFVHVLSHFKLIGHEYSLKDNYLVNISKVSKFESDFLILSWEQQEDLYKSLCPFIGQQPFNVADVLPLVLAIDKIGTGRSQEFYSSVYFNTLLKYDENSRKLDECICDIDEGYKKLTVDFIFTEKVVVEMLFANGITTVHDLADLSLDSLLVIFACDFEYYLSILNTLTDDFEVNYKLVIKDVIDKLNDNEKEIIFLRNGFNGNPKMTLEEVGEKYQLTRERVRQIEAKGMKKVYSDIHLSNTLFASIYFNLTGKNDKYLTKEKFKRFVNDDILGDFILLLMQLSENYIVYDDKFEVIYDKKISSLEEISNEIMDAYGDYMTVTDFDSLDGFEKKVILNNYRLINEKVYLRRGVQERKLVTNIIDDIFPDG